MIEKYELAVNVARELSNVAQRKLINEQMFGKSNSIYILSTAEEKI
jgi:hypothetical protein